jgi:hypothetical protein
MEKDTPEGVFAKEATKAFYNSFKGNVWYEFNTGKNVEEKEKYGRTLVDLYSNEKKTVHLNKFLYQFNDSSKGVEIVYDYDGGTKSEYAKKLNQRSVKLTEKMQTLLDAKLEAFVESLS